MGTSNDPHTSTLGVPRCSRRFKQVRLTLPFEFTKIDMYIGRTKYPLLSLFTYCSPPAPLRGSEQLCGENTECIFDAIVAGLDVGASTLAAGEEFDAEVQAVGGGELNY